MMWSTPSARWGRSLWRFVLRENNFSCDTPTSPKSRNLCYNRNAGCFPLLSPLHPELFSRSTYVLDVPPGDVTTAARRYVSAEQIEDVVRQLKDIVSTRAVLGPSGRIDELHVLVNPKRAPKQIARDIESALRAHLDVSLDYKKISIAQVQGRAALGGGGACRAAAFALRRCFPHRHRQPGRSRRPSETGRRRLYRHGVGPCLQLQPDAPDRHGGDPRRRGHAGPGRDDGGGGFADGCRAGRAQGGYGSGQRPDARPKGKSF